MTVRVGESTVFVGSTPRGIRRQHFRELSRTHDHVSEVEFAELVLRSSLEERVDKLKQFYVGRDPSLASLGIFTSSGTAGNLGLSGQSRGHDTKKLKSNETDSDISKPREFRRKRVKTGSKKRALSTRIQTPPPKERIEESCGGEFEVPGLTSGRAITNETKMQHRKDSGERSETETFAQLKAAKEDLTLKPEIHEDEKSELLDQTNQWKKESLVTSPVSSRTGKRTSLSSAHCLSGITKSAAKHTSYAASLLDEIIPTGDYEPRPGQLDGDDRSTTIHKVQQRLNRTSVLDELI